MLGSMLLGGGGLGGAGLSAGLIGGGAALVAGGGGDGDGTGEGGGTGDGDGDGDGGGGEVVTPADPFVNDPETSTNVGGDDTATHTLTVSGGGEPGDSVDATVGDQTQTVVIADDGTFTVVFEGDTFPADGTHETSVIVTTGTGDVTLDGPGFVIDTIAPEVTVTHGTESVGDFFNAESFGGGVSLSSTGEAGATVDVTVQGITRSTTVSETGEWTVRWQTGTLQGGEYNADVHLVTTDAFGNSRTSMETLVVDTVSEVTINTATVEINGVINGEEIKDGAEITGTSQPGSSVDVTFGGVTHTVTTATNGTWVAAFSASEIASGEYTGTVTAVATDSFGNTATATGNIDVDTLVRNLGYTSTSGGADGVINAAEAGDGMVVSGTTEPGSTLSVTLGSVTHAATVDANGNWTVSFTSGEVAPGTYSTTMTATATDAAGNVASVDQAVNVDTEAGLLTVDSDPIETDDVINRAERQDGVAITDTSDANAVVQVTLCSATTTVQSDANGIWSATFTRGGRCRKVIIPRKSRPAPPTRPATPACARTASRSTHG